MIERQYTCLKDETSKKRVTRCLDLSKSQASRLAEETEITGVASLQDMRLRKASLEASLPGEQILARKTSILIGLHPVFSSIFPDSKLSVMFYIVMMMNIYVAVSHIAALFGKIL